MMRAEAKTMPSPKNRQTPKTNPVAPEMVTVRLPKEMPAGLEFRYDPKLGGMWRIKTKKGLRAYFDLLNSGALS